MDTPTAKDRAAAYRDTATAYTQLAAEVHDEGQRRHLERLAADCEATARAIENGNSLAEAEAPITANAGHR